MSEFAQIKRVLKIKEHLTVSNLQRSGVVHAQQFWIETGILGENPKKRISPFFFVFGLEGPCWGQPQGPNFSSPWATMLALRLYALYLLQQHSPLLRKFYPSEDWLS